MTLDQITQLVRADEMRPTSYDPESLTASIVFTDIDGNQLAIGYDRDLREISFANNGDVDFSFTPAEFLSFGYTLGVYSA